MNIGAEHCLHIIVLSESDECEVIGGEGLNDATNITLE